MKLVFFGTGKFAIATVRKLINSGHEVKAVVTQPDAKRGRGYNLHPALIRSFVEKTAPGLAVFQPDDVTSAAFIDSLKGCEADIFVVVDYGQKLSRLVLELPKKYCINLHPSLLPAYRGASPINRAVADGLKITGNTVIRMSEKMDAGDIILQDKVDIGDEETAGELSERLSHKGAEMVLKAIDLIEKGGEKLIAQDGNKATYAYKLRKSDGKVDWTKNAEDIRNMVRGLAPWPGAHTYAGGKLIKIISAGPVCPGIEAARPGTIVDDKDFIVSCGKGCIKIKDLQPEGRSVMSGEEFLRGHRLGKNTVLG